MRENSTVSVKKRMVIEVMELAFFLHSLALDQNMPSRDNDFTKAYTFTKDQIFEEMKND